MDVTLENFENEVVNASAQQPVLVDFWASWCQPCKTLTPILEKLETEYAGRFKLAKIDSEAQQQLAAAFGIRSVPTCILLMNGQPVDGFMGTLPESEIRKFLDKNIPSEQEAQAAQEGDEAQQALAAGDTESALEKLQHAVATDPANDDARFDYVKLLLRLGHNSEAQTAFAPVAGKADGVQRFASLKAWMDAIAQVQNFPDIAVLDARIAQNKRDFEARLQRAQWLMAQQKWEAAMDELLEILMRDKNWNEAAARKLYIAILDVMAPPVPQVEQGKIPPEDPTVASYRRRLSSVVLS